VSVVRCRWSVVRIEEIEDSMGVFFNSQVIGRPGGRGDAMLEVFHLKPVFNINGQQDGIP